MTENLAHQPFIFSAYGICLCLIIGYGVVTLVARQKLRLMELSLNGETQEQDHE